MAVTFSMNQPQVNQWKQLQQQQQQLLLLLLLKATIEKRQFCQREIQKN